MQTDTDGFADAAALSAPGRGREWPAREGTASPGIQQPPGRCRRIKTQKAKWQREM